MPYSLRRPLTVPEKNAIGVNSDVLAHLLFHRGLTTSAAAEKFLTPDYDRDVLDPFLLKDAEKAADRLIHAIEAGETIAIYSDYDADGIPGAAVWNDFFHRINYKNFLIYIPHRHDEGFGLHVAAIEELAGKGAKVMVSVDCGITDVIPAARAKELGVDLIITDHHEPPPVLPIAFAIVDHKQADCIYPDKNLCGSGVAYKLIQAILKKNRFGMKEGMEKWLLDLVGMATLSDMVQLQGENRALAHYGLSVLRKSPRKGLVRLFALLKMSQRHVTEDDIAFMVTPRINAASRMGVPMDAFNLLAADNDLDASMYAEHLDAINNERKGVVASLVKEVKHTMKTRHGDRVPSVIVLGNPAWRPSLLGLAANSCAEEFNRPVFLWGRDGENLIKGSCRSEGTTHLVELMRAAPAGTFMQFGGHRFSGGFGVNNDAVHYLEQRLNETFEQILNSKSDSPAGEQNNTEIQNSNDTDMIDLELSLDSIDNRFYEDIAKLAPFGVGNPKPLFLFRDVVPSSVRKFGKVQNHMELGFKKSDGKKLAAISFFGAAEPWAKILKSGQTIDLVAAVEKSMYRGRADLRLRVVDVIIK